MTQLSWSCLWALSYLIWVWIYIRAPLHVGLLVLASHQPLCLTYHICEAGRIKILKNVLLRIELGDVYESAINMRVTFKYILLVVVNERQLW